MDTILLKLINKSVITEKDIKDALYEMCDNNHGSCNSECLVYTLNNDEIPYTSENGSGCDCFKDGQKMLDFIKGKI